MAELELAFLNYELFLSTRHADEYFHRSHAFGSERSESGRVL